MSRIKHQTTDENLDYTISYADRLPTGDDIADSEWLVPDGLTGSGESISGQSATIFLTGGELGRYRISNQSTSEGGRVVEDFIILEITESDF